MEKVLHDLELVDRAAADLGLQLNHDKSKLISINSTTKEALLSVASASIQLTQAWPLYWDDQLVASLGWTVSSGQREKPWK